MNKEHRLCHPLSRQCCLGPGWLEGSRTVAHAMPRVWPHSGYCWLWPLHLLGWWWTDSCYDHHRLKQNLTQAVCVGVIKSHLVNRVLQQTQCVGPLVFWMSSIIRQYMSLNAQTSPGMYNRSTWRCPRTCFSETCLWHLHTISQDSWITLLNSAV